MYYLNSRYYDSRTGRFINADGQLNGGLLGYNQFAYCENNPVMLSDQMGNFAQDHKMVTYAPGTPGRRPPVYYEEKIKVLVFIKKMFDDSNNFNLYNKRPEKVFKANYYSFYNGKLVIKTNFDTSFSFGFIALSNRQQNVKTLNHEYGHTIQLEKMGTGKYIVDVAIPSVTINVLRRADKLNYDYYGAPFEAQADLYGNVNRKEKNTPWPAGVYNSYFDLIRMFFEE